MKLLRLKITDSAGFRSLPCGFEHHFRTEWSLQEELAQPEGFGPFVCAGPNGSGKSNLLEALAAIFFQLEVQRVRRNFLPDIFQYDPDDNPEGIQEHEGHPNAYELEYLIKLPKEHRSSGSPEFAHVVVIKERDKSPWLRWGNNEAFPVEGFAFSTLTDEERDLLLPQYVLGYSSGENEILSLPFFKMRFIQFDEYSNALARQLPYPGRPETRLAYLDSSFSQAILLCNLLFQDAATLQPFREDVGIEALQEFRIVLRRSVPVTHQQVAAFTSGEYVLPTETQDGRFTDTNVVYLDPETGDYRLNLLQGLEANERTERTAIVEKLKRCATLHFHDEATDTLVLDYWVNEATKQAFRANFDDPVDPALALFQALQVLLTLNLYSVSDTIKADLYRSTSHYVSETVPTLASDQRIMRFKNFYFTKQGVKKPMLLKDLSDGEYQMLHSLGLCLLFRKTNSLFLLDEPETHFNPHWRASFITRLRQCLPDVEDAGQEMLVTTHTPFLISDSKPDKVLVFAKDKASGEVSISKPNYNTLGASINKITMNTFGKRETIGGYAQVLLDDLRKRFEEGHEDRETLITEINQQLGDSVEKLLLIKTILDGNQPADEEAQD
ncbi:MAG: ABC transporter [Nitrosomonadales bacterium SCN 54-20]|uniref:restriction system-associated AAA family ATPase n=1 Tax=Nitrosomonas europaea TaxID=915 RepID=UPI00086C227B|nr:restriction system-associated AAA family ATPase [Nitrosomonas europaea]ODT61877.1 MAG: ABC transporter [Nitrosomonadales bacterium SCN 54-20]HRN80975.1 restriction system-associated AAA family ATPase [Nitrosomonas europaea]HRO55540.1 restriction system-associated AAA family ATPase [Nitrosomonas europaea]HRQ07441.1 restriction system-associated AAA family ATPase [Nitrosomonas europaea]HUM73150.1 restriction system-associated AAA family ATPase [Nitrosomonas europaea]